MPFSRAGVAEHEECHLPLSSPGDYGVPGRHPCSHRPCRHSRGWVGESARSMSRTKSHINDKSSLGMQRMTRQKHPRARPEGSEFGGGIPISTSEPMDTYDHTTQVGQHHWIGEHGEDSTIGVGGSNLRDGLDPCDMQTGTSSGRIWRSSTSGRNDAGSDGVCVGVCVGRERRCVGSRSWQLGSFSVFHHFPAPSSSYPESNVRYLTVTNSISECLRCLL